MAAAGAFDAVILGAGAAGLLCAARAGQRGLRVLLIDHAERVAEKVRISGGGRANFTNRELDAATPERHYLSANPRFCRSALARFRPPDFIALLERHGIGWHEKHRGQLFCDRSARDLIDMLLAECAAATAHGGRVERWQPCRCYPRRLDPDKRCPRRTGMGVRTVRRQARRAGREVRQRAARSRWFRGVRARRTCRFPGRGRRT